jgi:hypothetical protein
MGFLGWRLVETRMPLPSRPERARSGYATAQHVPSVRFGHFPSVARTCVQRTYLSIYNYQNHEFFPAFVSYSDSDDRELALPIADKFLN